MRKGKRGFTIVEVAIFLAITGLLFIGITIGVRSSIYQQRRNDSVQGFVEFLRGVYSSVENTQNWVMRGHSEKAIYGKLVTFGESLESDGTNNDDNKLFVYTVIGDVEGPKTGDIRAVLGGLNASVLNDVSEYNESDSLTNVLAGYVDSYTLRWGARVVKTCSGSSCSYDPLKGALLVVRHPNSGVIHTLYKSNGPVEVNWGVVNGGGAVNPLGNFNSANNYMGFSVQEVDFCVNPTGEKGANDVVDIRILSGASSAAGIEQIPENDPSVKCGAHR